MNIRTIEVDVAGNVAIDDIIREEDFAERLNVSYYIGKGGAVMVTGVMQNDARPGKPPIWIHVVMPRFVTRVIEKMIEDDIEEERRLGAVA